MDNEINSKLDLLEARDGIFDINNNPQNALQNSKRYSLLLEEFILKLTANKQYDFALVSAGSFSRRELSPYSDIDIIIISEAPDKSADEIRSLITLMWDNGIEASHTVRDFNDIEKFFLEDIHTFTQFFETRFLLGSKSTYNLWNEKLISMLTKENEKRVIQRLIDDVADRYAKYGDSPKLLEPNVKSSAGGLRDFQIVEWMYIIASKNFLNKQNEQTQAESFIELLIKDNYTTREECKRLLESYNLVLTVRNLLHTTNNQKTDRFEYSQQKEIAEILEHKKNVLKFMKEYFRATNILNRFSKAMLKKFKFEITNPLPDSLAYNLDEDFVIKGKTISLVNEDELSFSDILRGFYYRGLHTGFFDEKLRSKIVRIVEDHDNYNLDTNESSVFFREILKLDKNTGQTLSVMNELGVLALFLPEFKDLIGFFQPGVYHCFTTDEHTLYSIMNAEKLEKDVTLLGKIYNSIKDREILFLALLFHDIAKPIDISGHEIIGAEMASSIMTRLGYSDEEIERVVFLVRNHLLMEKIAFRRNLNDAETLNNFASKFNTVDDLNLLYLITYADLSAVNSAVWTSWKAELLAELYRKSKAMIEEQISGEELLVTSIFIEPKEISKHSDMIEDEHVQEHFDAINDIAYAHHFTEEEIARHIEEIRKGTPLAAIFKEDSNFTNVTIITKDFPSLLSKICGVLSINDANIHDAKIFTSKDKIVIDNFNITDFRTHKKLDPAKYEKITVDLENVIKGNLSLNIEFANMRSKWKRIESRFFKRSGKIKILFEKHERYTIIDVFSPDRLGFLYQVSTKMNQLGLIIYFAKISTKGDDIVDSFYVLNRNGKKVSPNDYDFIKNELTSTITQIL